MNHSTGDPLPEPTVVHARIAKTLAEQASRRLDDSQPIHAYARRHLPEHAAAGENMDEDTIKRAILPYLDVTTLKDVSSSAELPLMPLVRKVAHAWTWEQPARNAAALRFVAAAEHFDISESDLSTPWRVSWAKSTGPSEILARVDSFASLAAARLGGRIVVVTAAGRGRVDLWDLASGRSDPLPYQSAGVSAVAIESVAGGGALVSTGTERGRVRCWRVRWAGDGRTARLDIEEAGSFDVSAAAVTALSVTTVLGRPHILAGQANGLVSLLDCESGRLLWQRRVHDGRVTGIAPVQLANGVPAAISVGVDCFMRLSHLRKGLDPIRPRCRSDDAIMGVAALWLDGKAVAVTAGDAGEVRIWDLPPESPRFRRVPGHDQNVSTLAAGTGQREQLVVTGDSAGLLRLVDPAQARIVGTPMEAHRNGVTGLACSGASDGRLIAISGGTDGTVRTWDLAAARRDGSPGAGEPAGPGAQESLVRLWRLGDGRELGQPAGAHTHRMAAVAVGRLTNGTAVAVTDAGDSPRAVARRNAIVAIATADLPDGRTVAVSANADDCLLLWDLSPCPDLPPRASHTLPHPGVRSVITAARADGRPVAVSAGQDRALRIWDIHDEDAEPLGPPLTGHRGQVTALATAAAPSRPTVVVSGSDDTNLRVWDVDSGQPIGATFPGSRRRIKAVAAAYVGDNLIVVTACWHDSVVRTWDLFGTDAGPRELTGHDRPVTAIAISGPPERPFVVTASEDNTVRVWDLKSATPAVDHPMPVPGTVRAIAGFDAPVPSAIIAGDDVLAVVSWGHPYPLGPVAAISRQ